MCSFPNVELRLFDESSFSCRKIGTVLTLCVDFPKLVFFRRSDVLKEVTLGLDAAVSRLSSKTVSMTVAKNKNDESLYFVCFESIRDLMTFVKIVNGRNGLVTVSDFTDSSIFDKRTEPTSAVQYFQFYSYLSQQQNMMQDYIRTSTYQRAILANSMADFRGKVVLDVGAGSGILSFFAIQAGAIRVYAVEASNVAKHCNALVQSNKLAGRIVVISGKIEEISLPEPVDVIISEPMGYMLYNERMLESYVHARKFLVPRLRQPTVRHSQRERGQRRRQRTGGEMMDGVSHVAVGQDIVGDSGDEKAGGEEAAVGTGRCSDCGESSRIFGDSSDTSETEAETEKMYEGTDECRAHRSSSGSSIRATLEPGIMFPTVANLYIAPFSDEALFAEQYAKANFWYQQSFHGMDLTALRDAAVTEYFNQPIVDTFDIGVCLAQPCAHRVDFRTISEEQLTLIDIPLHYQLTTSSTVHGLAFWFDVGFLGSQRDVWLSTAPTEPLTHWYQVRCLLGTPLFVQDGQTLSGRVTMKANPRQSYDVQIELVVPGSLTKITNTLDLKNPHFRYSGYPPAPPPGSHSRCPTEAFYASLYQQQQQVHQDQSASSLATVAANPFVVGTAPPSATFLSEEVQANQVAAVVAAGSVHHQSVAGQVATVSPPAQMLLTGRGAAAGLVAPQAVGLPGLLVNPGLCSQATGLYAGESSLGVVAGSLLQQHNHQAAPNLINRTTAAAVVASNGWPSASSAFTMD